MTYSYSLSKRRLNQLSVIDTMPPEIRACVHEFGAPIVNACWDAGVRSPRKIRHLVKEIWAGARQEGQKNDARGTLDWLLQQNGCSLSSVTLTRLLAEHNMAIVSSNPTRAMIDASIATVSQHNIRLTKEEKHRLRLMAAIRTCLPDMGGTQ